MSRGEQPPSAEVERRLLKAWQGEVEAAAVYERIAQRTDDRRAGILRRMAEAEAGHRHRLEARMTELGVPIPDVATVRPSRWLRLQAKVAPVDRLLAAREAAEDDEVSDLYGRSTGDDATDQLLHEIRADERSHSRAVKETNSWDRLRSPSGLAARLTSANNVEVFRASAGSPASR